MDQKKELSNNAPGSGWQLLRWDAHAEQREAGPVFEEYRYDALGRRVMARGRVNTNRYYDPLSGQFTQQDPIGLAGGMNLYGYANGDPVSYSDPFGLCPPQWLCDLIGASAGQAATEHWAEVANRSDGIERAVATGMGLLSALWTPDTYLATASTLAAGLGASKLLAGGVCGIVRDRNSSHYPGS